jgi:phosphohistidine phosphatase
MALYVVQHGKCLPKTEDPEKGLSVDGKRDTERIAAVAKGYAVTVSRIAHSGKKRARETAVLFADALSPPEGIEVRSGMHPLDDVSLFARQVRLDQDMMLVGHLPFMERLVGFLVCGNVERTIFKLQNSGIVCLDHVPHVDNPVIRWALMPSVG